MYFLGLPITKKGWLLYDLDNQKLIISRDVRFHKHIFPYVELISLMSYLPVQPQKFAGPKFSLDAGGASGPAG